MDNRRAIALLAKESTMSIDEVSSLYERERSGLEATARLKGFIPILAFRRVRRLLRQDRIEARRLSVAVAEGSIDWAQNLDAHD